MSTLSQFAGGARTPVALINGHSSGGTHSISPINSWMNIHKPILSGALVAGVYKELLAISGAGAVKFLVALTKDVTARTVGLKVVLDGVTVFDAVSSSITAGSCGLIAVGAATAGGQNLDSVHFNSSLSVSVKSSISETDKLAIETSYVTY